MSNVLNHIFAELERNKRNNQVLIRVARRNTTSMILAGVCIYALGVEVYSNTKRIEKLEAEIKELKGE